MNEDYYLRKDDAIRLRTQKLDVYKSFMPKNCDTTLIESLFNPNITNVDQLLRLIDDNLDTMTSFYIAVSFEVLDDHMRSKFCDPCTVVVSPEFKRLCTKALYKMRYFESDEVIKVIKCLSTAKIPEDSLIGQAALKMARCLINDFEPQELKLLSGYSRISFLPSDKSIKSIEE